VLLQEGQAGRVFGGLPDLLRRTPREPAGEG